MILLCAIVQSEDADLLISHLIAQGLRVTRINSAGGFLPSGNVTLLVGVEENRVEDVIRTIRTTCHSRTRFINAMSWGTETVMASLSVISAMEVQVGGATIFGLPVKRFLRLQGGAAPPAADEHHSSDVHPARPESARSAGTQGFEGGTQQMNLVIAIVHSDYVEAVTRALLAAGHRLTRINTAGGFLRRGNATLLIGVEAAQVDEVLNLIQAQCPLHTEPNPLDVGIPTYGATVFVLETTKFARV
ncbi:MAG: cyclic-di-AMP receptor [Chloroflexi bacterium]|nr:cyclic-di-AMP receptor [Chloroflexota bacterium]